MLFLILCMDDELNNNKAPTVTAPAIRQTAQMMWVHNTIRWRQKYSEYYHLVRSCRYMKPGPRLLYDWLVEKKRSSNDTSAFLKS